MYTRHKIAVFAVFILTAIFCYFAEILYENLAITAITVVSISVAIYIAAMSALLGSPYADRLKSIRDSKIVGNSQLGVLTTYLRVAGNIGVLTIVISILFQIPAVITVPPPLRRLVSSFACGTFAVNVLFLWLIFQFLTTSLVNSARNCT